MATVTNLPPTHNPTMSYARLYTLDGYRVQTPYGTRFVDHDGHVYALDAEQAAAVCDLGAVPQVERANVLAALAQCEETR